MPASYDDFFGKLGQHDVIYLEIVAVVTYFSKCARNDPRRILVAVIMSSSLTLLEHSLWLDVYLVHRPVISNLFRVFTDGHLVYGVTLGSSRVHQDSNVSFLIVRYWRFIWLVFTALADIAISIALIRHLITQEVAFQATKRLLRRIVAMTLGTGLLTSFGATAVLLSFVININSNVSTGILLPRPHLRVDYDVQPQLALAAPRRRECGVVQFELIKTVGTFRRARTAGNSPYVTTATSSDRKPEAKDSELGSEVGVKESEVENKKEIVPEKRPDVDSPPP
ncbi:hypothetical protein C8J56DRAFT_899289 [Mycena floridula]|nr:hypothetical protein C8J56DRAFT_899289 [Mycena floridula]